MKVNLGTKLAADGPINNLQSSLENLESYKANYNDYSTQKKNIFYYSFKNIRDRYQYKEQRINKIQMRNEKISKQMMLPPITTSNQK